MFKLDFSDIQKRGHRINQFRFFHSSVLRSSAVDKLCEEYTRSGDIVSKKNLVISYLTEKSEISFTFYYLYAGLMIFCFVLFILSILFLRHVFMISFLFLGVSFIFYRLALRSRENFIMGNVGIRMSESFYDSMIEEKYNFKMH